VKIAMTTSISAYHKAGEMAKANKDLVDMVLASEKKFLESAPESVRNNLDIARRAVKNNWEEIEFVGPEGKKDKELIMYALEKSGTAIDHVDPAV
jgi:hypothetical protein